MGKHLRRLHVVCQDGVVAPRAGMDPAKPLGAASLLLRPDAARRVGRPWYQTSRSGKKLTKEEGDY